MTHELPEHVEAIPPNESWAHDYARHAGQDGDVVKAYLAGWYAASTLYCWDASDEADS